MTRRSSIQPRVTHDDRGNIRKTIRVEHVGSLRLVCFECGQEDAVQYSPHMSWAHRLGWRPYGDEWLCPRCAFTRRRPYLPESALVTSRPDALRAWKWWTRYCDGETLAEIGDSAGLTRERVRQVLTKHYGNGLLGLARYRSAARRRLRCYVEGPERTAPACTVCGEPRRSLSGPPTAYPLCTAHQWVRNHLMYTIDEHRRSAHQNFPSQRQPRKTDKTWPEHRRRRFLQQGSSFHVLCTEAWEKGWPLIDRLPPEIVEQLEQEAVDA